MDAPPHGYGGGHQADVGGQAGTPPVASRVCCTSFHDPHVAELGLQCQQMCLLDVGSVAASFDITIMLILAAMWNRYLVMSILHGQFIHPRIETCCAVP